MTRSRSPIRKWHREGASHRGETSQRRSSRWFYFPLMKMFQQLCLLTISKYFSLWASKKIILAISGGAAFIKTRAREKRKQLVKISFHPPIWQNRAEMQPGSCRAIVPGATRGAKISTAVRSHLPNLHLAAEIWRFLDDNAVLTRTPDFAEELLRQY